MKGKEEKNKRKGATLGRRFTNAAANVVEDAHCGLFYSGLESIGQL